MRLESLEEDMVVDVDYDGGVDAAEGFGACVPQVHVLFVFVEVVDEHPIPPILLLLCLVFISGSSQYFFHYFHFLLGG